MDQPLKPYFTDEIINLIIMRNVGFINMSKVTKGNKYS